MAPFEPDLIAFYALSAVVVGLALMAVTAGNLVRAVIALAFSFFAVGGVFWILGSPFLAVLQLVINAGAIPVVTIFIVMMTQGRRSVLTSRMQVAWGLLLAAPLATAIVVLGVAPGSAGWTAVTPLTVERLGYELLSVRGRESTLSTGEAIIAEAGTIVAFEVVALVLLVAFVGAIILAKREEPTLRPGKTSELEPEVADADS